VESEAGIIFLLLLCPLPLIYLHVFFLFLCFLSSSCPSLPHTSFIPPLLLILFLLLFIIPFFCCSSSFLFSYYSIETTEPAKSAWRFQSMYHLILGIFSQHSFKNIWSLTFARAETALLMLITLYPKSLTVPEDIQHMRCVFQMPCSRERHSLSSRLANLRGNTGGRTSRCVTYASAGGLRFPTLLTLFLFRK
jgi:hypothetical protein